VSPHAGGRQILHDVSLAELFSRHWDGDFTLHARGNLRACIGFLLGKAVDDFPSGVLHLDDSPFPLHVPVEAHKAQLDRDSNGGLLVLHRD
jgi:hypothetical protein